MSDCTCPCHIGTYVHTPPYGCRCEAAPRDEQEAGQ